VKWGLYSLAIAVVGLGGFVSASWLVGFTPGKHVFPGFVTMKFATALGFLFSGCLLLTHYLRNDHPQVTSGLACSLLVIVLGVLLPGIEPFADFDTEVFSVAKGTPSLATVACFFAFSLLTLFELAGVCRKKFRRQIGLGLAVCATIALAGYAFTFPWAYYYVPGVSTAMAVHTAFGFLLLGSFLLCVKS